MNHDSSRKKTKNIQVIDGADNCTYSIFAISEELFDFIFPEVGQDIEFEEDFNARFGTMSKQESERLLDGFWNFPVDKKKVKGIHGTLFYGLSYKKKFYPTKREGEMVVDLTVKSKSGQ